MKLAKKLVSLLVATFLLANSLTLFAQVVCKADELTPEQIAAKNYPVPSGYAVKSVLQTYDSTVPGATDPNITTHSVSQSTEAGTYYDGGSMKYTSTTNYREICAYSSTQTLDGDGFCFWYQSASSVAFRLRSSTNSILNYGTLPASTSGTWVTVYYYGKVSGFTYNTSSVSTSYQSRVDDGEMLKFNIMSTSSTFSCYIDEFFTFEATETANDVYDDESTFFKFSLAKFETESKTLGSYGTDGSVTLTSTYGTTASQYPINITYNVDSTAVSDAIAKANATGGSGFLQISLTNSACQNSTQTANQWLKFILTINGINKQLIRYNYEVGTTSTYLIDVHDVTDASLITTINVNLQATSSSTTITNVQAVLSPITVYELPANSTLYQAEDLDPKVKLSSTATATDASISVSTDQNNTYAYISSSVAVGGYLEMTLPNATVGQYNVYVRTLDTSTRSTFMFTVNSLNPIKNINFANSTYTSYGRDTLHNIGTVSITKSGENKLRFTVTTKVSSSIYLDYIVLEYVGTATEEPASNFVINDYPTMTDYEVKTVLATFNDYICGTDSRWLTNQVYGYVGDGNAFNLNSRATVGKSYFDNNNIVSSITLDGNGIRFWYKSTSSATMQFATSSSILYTVSLSAQPTAAWKTIYYTSLVANGDVSNITKIMLKTSSTTSYYIDELHTIQMKLGDMTYSVSNNQATVTGYTLRVQDAIIPSTYNGYPVVAIADSAFSGNKNLKTVTLPDSVVSIGQNAFNGCLNLNSVTFGSGLTTIGANAFNGCVALGDVTMTSNISSIASTAFTGCTNLTLIVEPSSYSKVFALTNSVRYRCYTTDGFTYIYSNGEIRIIDYNGATSDITIPSQIDGFNVTSIADATFRDNLTITSVVIPDTVLTVGNSAFEGCTALTSVTMSNLANSTIGASVFAGCTALTSISLGTGVITIGDSAFASCTALAAIYLPSQLTLIADNAFDDCDNLIVSMSTSSYAYTYVNTVGLKYIPTTTSDFKYSVINYQATVINYTGTGGIITVPTVIDGYTVVAVGASAFVNNATITSMTFSDTIVLIDTRAFFGCSGITTIDFGEVRKINSYAFGNCIGLTALTVLDLVDVSTTAFDGCVNLTLTVEETQFLRSALDFVDDMTVGWNLGNTLESYNNTYSYGDLTVAQSETLWGAPVTTQAMIDLVAQSGYNTIRIPITWQAFIDDNYNIDQSYMDRVKEVVGYAYNNNMYVVINIHHDQWLNLSSANFDEMVAEYEAVWAQIADEFKYYDEKLIFESMNEVRYNEDWYGQTDEILTHYNTLNQSFYDLVRASGGLNDERYLMMETYAAQFSSHQLNAFWIPSAATDNHIIASVHMYNNSMTESTYTPNLQAIYNKFIANGIPCIIGETGIPSAWTSEAACANWATFFLGQCNEYGIKCFLWDDHGNYTMMYRTSLTWKYPTFVEAIQTATSPAEIDPLLDADGDRLIDNQLYGELTGADIFAKGYSQPNGFKAKTVLQTYDDTVPGATDPSITEYSVSQSTTSGTSYDGGSMQYTSTTDGREIPVFSSTQTLDGRGFCFWYQSATAVEFTLKTSAGTVLNFGTLAASTSGKWVTVYYSGATSGLTYDSASTTTNYQSYVDNDEMLTFNIVSTSTTFSCYIDEFFTFDAE